MSLQSWKISASEKSYKSSFYRKFNRNRNQKNTFPIGFPIETGLVAAPNQILPNFEVAYLSNEYIFFGSVKN